MNHIDHGSERVGTVKKTGSSGKRRLGMSDLSVSPVGLGTVQFSGGRGLSGLLWPPLSEDDIKGIVRVSVEGGVNWFDTAELYGRGESEAALSRALAALGIKRERVVIADKWWPLLRTAGSIAKTIDERLSRLGTDYIDLHQIHNPYSLSSIKAQMREMARLAGEGKIRYVGVSNFSAEDMRKAHMELSKLGLALVSNQVSYSLVRREIETNGVLDAAEDLGMTIIAYSPLGRGILTGKFHENPELLQTRNIFRRYYGSLNRSSIEASRPVVEALGRVARKYGVTLSQAAINWVINFRGDWVVAVPGATSVRQAEDNAGAMGFTLGEDDLALLGEASEKFRVRR
jgi:aryl-alcohol dehydrogenase-like predicted oxidoreductase